MVCANDVMAFCAIPALYVDLHLLGHLPDPFPVFCYTLCPSCPSTAKIRYALRGPGPANLAGLCCKRRTFLACLIQVGMSPSDSDPFHELPTQRNIAGACSVHFFIHTTPR